MHVSGSAKAAQIIIYASVSSPMPRPHWLGVWQVMHDASLLGCPAPACFTASKTTASFCPCFEKHLSNANLDLESARLPQHFLCLRCLSIYSGVFWLACGALTIFDGEFGLCCGQLHRIKAISFKHFFGKFGISFVPTWAC